MEWTPDFVAFVRENIFSVEQISVLSLLSREPQRSFSVEEIRVMLTSSTKSIGERLAVLRRRRLIEVTDDGSFRYRSDPKHDLYVQQLHEEFVGRPVRLIELVFSGRSEALESFSDAFRLGGDDDRS